MGDDHCSPSWTRLPTSKKWREKKKVNGCDSKTCNCVYPAVNIVMESTNKNVPLILISLRCLSAAQLYP